MRGEAILEAVGTAEIDGSHNEQFAMLKAVVRVIDAFPGFLGLGIQVGVFYLARLVSDRPTTFMGIDILRFLEGGAEAEQKVRRALSLIDRYDPRWLHHMRAKVRRIVITMVGTSPEFRPIVRGCYIPLEDVNAASDEVLALVLIHETAHARLHERIRSSAFRRPRPDVEERLERICVAREAAFAKKLPEIGAELEKWAKGKLDRRWWEPERRKEARRERLRKL